ncbi:MAG: MFS transporter [Haloarculaceae archaeon]
MSGAADASDAADSAGSNTRAAFAGLFVATGAAMLGFGIVEPIMPLYAQSLGASGVMLGIIFAGFAVARGVFAPITGRLSDQYGRKRMLLVGLGLYVVLSAAYVLADTPWLLTAVRFGQGLASVMVTPIAQSYVGDITPEGEEGAYMNLFYISLFGGMAVGPSVGGYLSDVYSFAAPFFALAGVALFALVVVALVVPARTSAEREADASDEVTLRASLSAVFADREMRGLIAYIGARGFYRWGFNSFFPVFAVSAAALSRTQVGFVLSGYMIAGGLLQYPMGRLSDRFPAARPKLVAVGGVLSAGLMFAVPTTTALVPLIALVIGMGVFSAVSRASSVAIRTERGRVHGMGAVTGAFTTSLSVGQVLGPLTFGAVVDVFDVRAAFYLGGAVGLVGTAAAYWFLYRGADDDATAAVAAEQD